MKILLLVFVLAAGLFSCVPKDRVTRLQSKVDSLHVALNQSKMAEVAMEEVGAMLDSIDISRHSLHAKIIEGITYAEYIDRLKSINNDIRRSETKIASLETQLKQSKGASSAAMHRLKTDLAAKSQEIVTLQMDVVKLREENNKMLVSANQKDSIISSRDEVIRLKSADVASLQNLVQDITNNDRAKIANLYFAQAEALEVAASRTKFAPRKKKETKREALELYRFAYSLGNTAAEAKIQQLEKDLG